MNKVTENYALWPFFACAVETKLLEIHLMMKSLPCFYVTFVALDLYRGRGGKDRLIPDLGSILSRFEEKMRTPLGIEPGSSGRIAIYFIDICIVGHHRAM
jgi:hypothetical protein